MEPAMATPTPWASEAQTYIDEIVAAAPPLTIEQQQRIIAVLQQGRAA